MAASGTTVVRVVGFTSLLLGPVVIVLDRLDAVDELTLFVLAAAALIPISWLIGEATDNVALYTGPGIGGFLNATFGNAPELIIAIVAIEHGSAVVLARRGRVKLAVEISMASSAQIAGLLIPLVVLIFWSFDPLALSFRPIELVAIGVAAVLPALVLRTGRTTRLGGVVLLFAYSLLVVCFYLSGDR